MSEIPAVAARSKYKHQYLHWSHRLNWLVERVCAILLGAMVLIVWFGVINRYFLDSGITWTEELSRYLMIWSALLAISCCARYREHIGFEMLLSRCPDYINKPVRCLIDVVAICFFLYLTFYGINMTSAGSHQYATIFGMSMMLPFAAVPVSSALTVIQIIASSLCSSPAGPVAEDDQLAANRIETTL